MVGLPRYTDDRGTTVEYELLGYTKNPNGTNPDFGLTSTISLVDFPGESTTLTLYAVWRTNYIVRFFPGDMDGVDANQRMDSIVVRASTLT